MLTSGNQNYAPAVGRMKSQRWVQASNLSYEGDDWGDEYGDYSEGEVDEQVPALPEIPNEFLKPDNDETLSQGSSSLQKAKSNGSEKFVESGITKYSLHDEGENHNEEQANELFERGSEALNQSEISSHNDSKENVSVTRQNEVSDAHIDVDSQSDATAKAVPESKSEESIHQTIHSLPDIQVPSILATNSTSVTSTPDDAYPDDIYNYYEDESGPANEPGTSMTMVSSVSHGSNDTYADETDSTGSISTGRHSIETDGLGSTVTVDYSQSIQTQPVIIEAPSKSPVVDYEDQNTLNGEQGLGENAVDERQWHQRNELEQKHDSTSATSHDSTSEGSEITHSIVDDSNSQINLSSKDLGSGVIPPPMSGRWRPLSPTESSIEEKRKETTVVAEETQVNNNENNDNDKIEQIGQQTDCNVWSKEHASQSDPIDNNVESYNSHENNDSSSNSNSDKQETLERDILGTMNSSRGASALPPPLPPRDDTVPIYSTEPPSPLDPDPEIAELYYNTSHFLDRPTSTYDYNNIGVTEPLTTTKSKNSRESKQSLNTSTEEGSEDTTEISIAHNSADGDEGNDGFKGFDSDFTDENKNRVSQISTSSSAISKDESIDKIGSPQPSNKSIPDDITDESSSTVVKKIGDGHDAKTGPPLKKVNTINSIKSQKTLAPNNRPDKNDSAKIGTKSIANTLNRAPQFDFLSALSRGKSNERRALFEAAREKEVSYDTGILNWLMLVSAEHKGPGVYQTGLPPPPSEVEARLAAPTKTMAPAFMRPTSHLAKKALGKVGEKSTKNAKGLFAKLKKPPP